MIKLTDFSSSEITRFCDFSRNFYSSLETTSQQIISWKMGVGTERPATHLTSDDGDKMVGRAALIPRSFSHGGEQFEVTQVSDLLIDPNESGGGTLLQLVNNFKALNKQFVFHTSNQRSDVIYAKLFKFDELCRISASVIPIRPARLLKPAATQSLIKLAVFALDMVYMVPLRCLEHGLEVLGGRYQTVLTKARVQEEAFYKKFRSVCCVQFTRDQNFIDRRYVQAPFDYETLTVKIGENVVCQVFLRDTTVENKRALVVLDVLSTSQIRFNLKAAIIGALLRETRIRKLDLIFFMHNKKCKFTRDFAGLPFVEVPEKLLPHPTPIYWHSKNFAMDTRTFDKLYFSLADLDYF